MIPDKQLSAWKARAAELQTGSKYFDPKVVAQLIGNKSHL